MKEESKKYPYVSACLKDRKGDLKKRWYIEYKVWNAKTSSLETKDLYAPSKLETAKARRAWAEENVQQINKLLESGYHLNPKPETKEQKEKMLESVFTVADAMEFVLKIKLAENRDTTFTKYKQIKNHFFAFATPELLDKPVKEFTANDAEAFYEYMLLNLDLAKQTLASNRVIFKGFFSTLLEKKKITVNPCPQNKKVVVKSSKNKSFNREQFAAVMEEIRETYPFLYTFILTMFYSFARPKELRLLKVRYVDLLNEKITITAETSKNGKERKVEVSPHLLPLLHSMNLHKYPSDFYVFGRSGGPGVKPVPINRFYNQTKAVLKRLGIEDTDLTLYSTKHTGVGMHFLNGVDFMALKDQTGHEDMTSFMVYLKSINLIENDRFKKNSPSFKEM